MICLQPSRCEERSLRNRARIEDILTEAELLLSNFQDKLTEGSEEVRLRMKYHAEQREMFRAFSRYEIVEAAKQGWAIDLTKRDNKTFIVIMYYLHTGPRSYRPIHVVCMVNSPFDWEIITVYDPRSKSWWWDKNLSTRVCWCNGEE